MNNRWFQTWNRPEYIEWALPQKYGYLLIIAKKEVRRWLLAQARLTFKSEGLPAFVLIKTETVNTKKVALEALNEWKNESL